MVLAEEGAMTTFVLIPGAGGQAWYWHRVVPRLRFRGHDAVAVDLPSGDENARLEDYVRTVVGAVPPGSTRDAGGPGLAVVGQSLGGLVAPIVAQRCAADLLVLVAPMVPCPGESGGEWWQATAQGAAMHRFAVAQGRDPEAADDDTLYFHDVPEAVRAEAVRRPFEQTEGPLLDPWPLDRWPDVPTRVVAGREDRLFPLEFTTALARERAGVEPDVIGTGHLAALADPGALADLLDRYAREVIGA
jgi:pimeloyl-ACP methyl ester carboxylesterase